MQVFVQEFGVAGAVAGAPGTTLGGVGGPAADLSDYFSDYFRDRLSRLDAVLDELEGLNLRGMTHLPVRLGNQLIEFGIDDPYDKTVTDLIDRVFELEEPLLSMVKSRPRSAWLWRSQAKIELAAPQGLDAPARARGACFLVTVSVTRQA